MESWRDQGVLLSTRRHGEGAAILELFTESHGRRVGMMRGAGTGRGAQPLQPGTQVAVEWRARLPEHMGRIKAEPLRSRSDAILSQRQATEAAASIAAMLRLFLPEREPHQALYAATVALYDLIGTDPEWPRFYVQWELGLLAELGFALDLSRCALTGGMQELIWVSPKSGRAVCRSAGAPWADRLLPLPGFLRGVEGGDVADGFRLTGHFLENWAARSLDKDALPPARKRLAEGFMVNRKF